MCENERTNRSAPVSAGTPNMLTMTLAPGKQPAWVWVAAGITATVCIGIMDVIADHGPAERERSGLNISGSMPGRIYGTGGRLPVPVGASAEVRLRIEVDLVRIHHRVAHTHVGIVAPVLLGHHLRH